MLTAPFGAMPIMKRAFTIPAFAALSACIAVAFEAMSVLVVLPSLRQYRPLWLLAALKFHLVIYLTMNPNYLPQSITYLPCVLSLPAAWRVGSVAGVGGWAWVLWECVWQLETTISPTDVTPSSQRDTVTVLAVLGASLLTAVLLGVAALGVEWWPLTVRALLCVRLPRGISIHFHILTHSHPFSSFPFLTPLPPPSLPTALPSASQCTPIIAGTSSPTQSQPTRPPPRPGPARARAAPWPSPVSAQSS